MSSRSPQHQAQYPGAAEAEGRLWEALHECPPLATPSPKRDNLWFVVRDVACTRTGTRVVPFGSTAKVEVTPEHAHDELLAAMEWMHLNEVRARTLSPGHLFAAVRAVATRGAHGSARVAQSDLLHGLTNVPSGTPVRWLALDEDGAA